MILNLPSVARSMHRHVFFKNDEFAVNDLTNYKKTQNIPIRVVRDNNRQSAPITDTLVISLSRSVINHFRTYMRRYFEAPGAASYRQLHNNQYWYRSPITTELVYNSVHCPEIVLNSQVHFCGIFCTTVFQNNVLF